ncbi:KfrB domain-containing protein [Cupriavidus nantongensis]|uniref:KfrB domain-containing protein n=1 Tax=Cupriavidus nantongensis TaxID=1796606 RepID=A0A142JIY9_9BURK|nr:hypothetical protein [Cupriavidus nantongensis]AMR78051.1 hypothetical protein A2G96_10015 [Cupriavidus nantongensis]
MGEKEAAGELAISAAEVEAERRIEERSKAAVQELGEKAAREWARLDVEDFGKIKDRNLARFAAVTITDNMENPAYKAEFERAGVETVALIHSLKAANDALVAEKEGRKAGEFEAMRKERQERAMTWTPEEAAIQAQIDVADYASALCDHLTNLKLVSRYEVDYRLNDMAEYAKANPDYREALEKAVPDLAKEIDQRNTVAQQLAVKGTYVGTVTALSGTHLEQKVGRDPRGVVVHDRRALGGDDVVVGNVVTITYEMGKGRLRNHELAVEQQGMGR